MKAYKLNLKEYEVRRSIANDGKKEEAVEFYGVKNTIANVMCHPSLQHNGFRFYTVSKLADRISNCKDDYLILDIAECEVIKSCFGNFKGFSRNDAEMVARVYEIKEIDVEETKKNG